MTLTNEQIKQLVIKYPFLAPHNSWTGKIVDGYDYSYTEARALPTGWHKLFYLLCKQFLPHIENSGLLNNFYFTNVTEKYGMMRVYTSCLPNSVDKMVSVFESFSKYVCQCCGNDSTRKTQGWTGYFCDSCLTEEPCYRLKKKNVATFECFERGIGRYKLAYSYRSIKTEYMKVKNMSDDEFLKYMME